MKVRVTKRAQAQIDRAALWWDENRPLAPEAFDEELAEVFSLLSVEPAIGALVWNVRTQGVRRLHLARISIALRARQDNLPIRDSDQLALIGAGYE